MAQANHMWTPEQLLDGTTRCRGGAEARLAVEIADGVEAHADGPYAPLPRTLSCTVKRAWLETTRSRSHATSRAEMPLGCFAGDGLPLGVAGAGALAATAADAAATRCLLLLSRSLASMAAVLGQCRLAA